MPNVNKKTEEILERVRTIRKEIDMMGEAIMLVKQMQSQIRRELRNLERLVWDDLDERDEDPHDKTVA